jgi:hypothetical protein
VLELQEVLNGRRLHLGNQDTIDWSRARERKARNSLGDYPKPATVGEGEGQPGFGKCRAGTMSDKLASGPGTSGAAD